MDVNDLTPLVKLTAKAWSLPILAQFGAEVAGRQAALLKATGAGRTAFGQSLSHLQELDLVERNPGHGHPLRPEYRLTRRGQAMAPIALDLWEIGDAHPLLRRQWSLPVLVAAQGPSPFGVLRRRLPQITDRALSQTLQHLQTETWMARDVDIAARPPRPLYQAVGTGAALAQKAERLLQLEDREEWPVPTPAPNSPVARSN